MLKNITIYIVLLLGLSTLVVAQDKVMLDSLAGDTLTASDTLLQVDSTINDTVELVHEIELAQIDSLVIVDTVVVEEEIKPDSLIKDFVNVDTLINELIAEDSALQANLDSVTMEPEDTTKRIGIIPYLELKWANFFYQREQFVKASKRYYKLMPKEVMSQDEKLQFAEVLIYLKDSDSAAVILEQVPESSLAKAKIEYAIYALNGESEKVDSILSIYPEIKSLENQLVEQKQIFYRNLSKGDEYSIYNAEYNTPSSDYGSVLYDDTLYFISTRGERDFWRGKYDLTGDVYQDIYRADGDSAIALDDFYNKPYHDGPIAFGDSMVVISRNRYVFSNYGNSKEVYNELQLIFSKLEASGTWSEPQILSFCEPTSSYTHPFVKGNTLYFTSDVQGGYGGLDIYYATITVRGEILGDITNMGPVINGKGNELFPFVDVDGTLYFSSESHLGLGALDIYKAELQDSAVVVKNMGHKINTAFDDFAFYIKNDTSGYFSSNRKGGQGDDDIYFYTIQTDFFVQVIDANTGLPIEGVNINAQDVMSLDDMTNADGLASIKFDSPQSKATFSIEETDDYFSFEEAEVIRDGNTFVITLKPRTRGVYGYTYDENEEGRISDVQLTFLSSADTFAIINADSLGNYRLELEKDSSYQIWAVKEGYFPIELDITQAGKEDWFEFNIPLSNFIELKGILYDYDKYDITKESEAILDTLTDLMNTYQWMNIELSSHTDCRGSHSYNQRLSQKRAESATDYILSNGIAPSRLVAAGYGETKLKNHCADGVQCSEEEHYQNRRTEVRLLE